MIHGKVLRQASTSLGTPGRLALDNGYLSDTLELPWHDNERGRSCTAPGVDRGKVWWSPTLKRLVVRYAGRNGRQDVLIHNGNLAADAVDQDGDGVPEQTQIHGCTEVGDGYGDIRRKDGRSQWGIRGSVAALERLIASLRCPLEEAETVVEVVGERMGFQDVEIEYAWAEGAAP